MITQTAALLALSLATSQTPDAGAPAGPNPMLRELAPIPVQKVQTGKFAFEIEAVAAPEVAEGADRSGVTVDLGTGEPMHCVVAAHFDHASTFRTTVEGLAAQREIRALGVERVESVGGWPLMIGQVVYGPKGNKKVAEFAKVAIGSAPQGGIFCFHAQPGYLKTFHRVMTAAFKSLKPILVSKDPVPVFNELHVVKAEKTVLGYYQRLVFKTDKAFEVLTRRSAVTALDGGKWLFHDNQEEQLTDADGNLAVERNIAIRGGKVVVDVTLKREDAETYSYSGTKEGKTISGKLTPTRPLASDLQVTWMLQKTLSQGTKGEVSFETYDASAALDKTAPVQASFNDAKTRELAMKFGAEELKASAAEDGTISRLTSAKGPKFTQERISVVGDWPTK